MLLSKSDIQKIENIGYDKNYFSRSKKRWLKLKNKDGRCVFHNGKICLIYENRPEGCKLYPLIFDNLNKRAIVDEECPYQDHFRFNKKNINQLFMVVTRIIEERKNRKPSEKRRKKQKKRDAEEDKEFDDEESINLFGP